MNKKIVKQKINKALASFIRENKFLLENDLNERTLSSKLSNYISKEFKEWDVDCEYNRLGLKKIDGSFITKQLMIEIDNIKSDDSRAVTVYPDIIIHKRGCKDKNLIVIEIKKHANSNKQLIEKDYKKIIAFMNNEEFKYKFGTLLFFNSKGVKKFEIFDKSIEILKKIKIKK
jgi:hypothetical protein